jgi:hypothetical protein|tara:strand:+ start:6888 stop:7127 length:240 start_codon:yes stop_codon:yes gene_type:complete
MELVIYCETENYRVINDPHQLTGERVKYILENKFKRNGSDWMFLFNKETAIIACSITEVTKSIGKGVRLAKSLEKEYRL